MPLGGSYVTFNDLYSNEIGNLGCGLEDKNNLKFLSTSFLKTRSSLASNSGNKDIDK